uniref:Uncharacterized protein n=1 Tax=Colobus angolensis palliatus TaxID=336983 RepID=A0A2K5JGE1_COLAP
MARVMTSECEATGCFLCLHPAVKDKAIFRRVTEKHFGGFSRSARTCSIPQGQTGRYLQSIKLTRGILLPMLFLDGNYISETLETQSTDLPPASVQ